MATPIYQNAAILFTILTVLLTGAVIYALHYALKKANWSPHYKKKVFRFSVVGILGWIGLVGLLANQHFFADFSSLPPRFILAIAPPWIMIGVLAGRGGFRYLLGMVPASWLVYLQSFRVVVEINLWMVFVAGVAPVQMTFEGRNFDILVGLTAPLAGYFVFRKRPNVLWGVVWNVFGLVLLMNIVITAVLSAPTPFRVFWNEPANTFVATLPFIWLPAFVVPVALALHVFSLLQLFQQARESLQLKNIKPLQKIA